MQTIIVPQEIQGIPTLGYREIVFPLEKLKAKYCYVLPKSSGFDIWLRLSESAEFDLYVARRLADPEWANRMEEEDLRKTRLMNSLIEDQEIETLMSRKQVIESTLTDLPTEIKLVNANLVDDRDLLGCLKPLFAACWIPGLRVRLAKINKFLWEKRQHLIAMVDRKVYKVLFGHEPKKTRDRFEHARQAIAALIRFQSVMNWTEGKELGNYRVLQSLSNEFTELLSAYLGGMGISPPHPRVNPVRVLDNLLWFDFHGYRHFSGWELNTDTGRVEPR